MNKSKFILFTSFALIFNSCTKLNNKISGFQPLTSTDSSTGAPDSIGPQIEPASATHVNARSTSGYYISGVLGPSSSGQAKVTTSGNYSVVLSVEGAIQSSSR